MAFQKIKNEDESKINLLKQIFLPNVKFVSYFAIIQVFFVIFGLCVVVADFWTNFENHYFIFLLFATLGCYLIPLSYYGRKKLFPKGKVGLIVEIILNLVLLSFFVFSLFTLFEANEISGVGIYSTDYKIIFVLTCFLSLNKYIWVKMLDGLAILFDHLKKPHKLYSLITKIEKLDSYNPTVKKLLTKYSLNDLQWKKESRHKHAYNLPPAAEIIYRTLIELNIISALSLIRPNNRIYHENNYGNDYKSDQGKILNYVESRQKDLKVECYFSCEGNLTMENIDNGAFKSKILEYGKEYGINLRAVNVDKERQRVVLYLFPDYLKLPQETLEVLHSIDTAFAKMQIKNYEGDFPEVNDLQILDQENNKIYAIRIRYKLPKGLGQSEIIDQVSKFALQSYVRKKIYTLAKNPAADYLDVFIELHKKDFSNLSYKDLEKGTDLRLPIGYDLVTRKTLFVNLTTVALQENDHGLTPHLLAAGATHSGKSVWAKQVILQMMRQLTPEQVRFILVDPKKVTFSKFAGCSYLLSPIMTRLSSLKGFFDLNLKVIEERYKQFVDEKVENIQQFNAKKTGTGVFMPYIVLIIDEFADSIDAQKYRDREAIIKALKRIGQMGRAAGFHMILLTQRATSQNIDGEIKANIAGKIAFKVTSEADSHFILGEKGAEALQNPGEGLANLGDDLITEFQAPNVSDAEVLEAVNFAQKTYGDKFTVDERYKSLTDEDSINIENISSKDIQPGKGMEIPFGYDLDKRKTTYLRFNKENGGQEITALPGGSALDKKQPVPLSPHVLVAGGTGSGKTVFTRQLIFNAIRQNSPEDLKVLILDPKAVSFTVFEESKHLVCPIIVESYLLKPVLEELIKLTEERYELFRKVGAKDIYEYNKITLEAGQKLYKLLVVIDEFADILDFHEYKERDSLVKLLKRLGQMARAAGVHMVLITQRATTSNIDGEIRANIAGRITFRTNTEADSYYTIGQSGAEKLEYPGQGIAKLEEEKLIHFICPNVSDEQMKNEMKEKNSHIQQTGQLTFEPRFLNIIVHQRDQEKTLKNRKNLSISDLENGKELRLALGINLNTLKTEFLNFNEVHLQEGEEVTPHLMVAGGTNSGKSVWAKMLIYNLIKQNDPKDLKLIIVDPKLVTFKKFENSKHLLEPIITDPEKLKSLLEKTLETVHERYKLFEQYGVENIVEYRKLTLDKPQIPYFFVIIDEFADMMDRNDYKTRDQLENMLKRLSQMARAAGVHMVFITQRATSQTINGELKANIAGKIAFKTNTEGDSYFILESNGAERLNGFGHGLARLGFDRLVEFQSPNIKPEDIEQLMKMPG